MHLVSMIIEELMKPGYELINPRPCVLALWKY